MTENEKIIMYYNDMLEHFRGQSYYKDRAVNKTSNHFRKSEKAIRKIVGLKR